MPERLDPNLRSPRSRALEIGTNAAGFAPAAPYSPQGGHPITPETPERVYQEQPATTVEGGAAPVNQPDPIKLGGG